MSKIRQRKSTEINGCETVGLLLLSLLDSTQEKKDTHLKVGKNTTASNSKPSWIRIQCQKKDQIRNWGEEGNENNRTNQKPPYSDSLPASHGQMHGTTQATGPQQTQRGLRDEYSLAANTPSKGRSPSTEPQGGDGCAHPYTPTRTRQQQQGAPLEKRPTTSFLLHASALKKVTGTGEKHKDS